MRDGKSGASVHPVVSLQRIKTNDKNIKSFKNVGLVFLTGTRDAKNFVQNRKKYVQEVSGSELVGPTGFSLRRGN